jgi:AraC-like DNA-binding protein
VYEERASAVVEGAVVWASASRAGGGEERVLPDGCMDLMWAEGDGVHRGLVVAGPDTRAQVGGCGGRWVGVRLAPGVGPSVFGVPACELTDGRVPLEALWPEREVRVLAERVAGAADVGAALEVVAAGRLREAGGPGPWRAAVVAALARGRGVAQTAWEVGLSERQLRRRSLAVFGYGPKTLARVLRMRRALGLARGGAPLAEVAARCGYADQAHLAREVKDLAGVPITAL